MAKKSLSSGTSKDEIMALIMEGKICPYCKSSSSYVDSIEIYGKSYGMSYWCKPCDAYVGTHKGEPTKALGRLAKSDLRYWKGQAHKYFDQLWQSNYMKRKEAYNWLAAHLPNIPREYIHIGMFGVEACKKVAELAKKELE